VWVGAEEMVANILDHLRLSCRARGRIVVVLEAKDVCDKVKNICDVEKKIALDKSMYVAHSPAHPPADSPANSLVESSAAL
jgi:hypothetical protein